jgi:hypothetical protein
MGRMTGLPDYLDDVIRREGTGPIHQGPGPKSYDLPIPISEGSASRWGGDVHP